MVGAILRHRTLPLIVAVVVITAMLLSPGGTVPSGPPHADKITHAVMFVVLAICCGYARLSPALTVVWLGLYGVLTEILQATVAVRRSGSFWDWCADLVGIAIGLAITAVVRRGVRADRKP
ncbi:VanZ family protein [Rhodococcus sp. NPDC047139]|uniref:VanZ family protein n=1 Tax=Rhodococcus sp. NPDC047139 TaxID=3155141 RepID=UPI0033F8A550